MPIYCRVTALEKSFSLWISCWGHRDKMPPTGVPKQQTLISPSLGVWKSKIEAPSGLVSAESSVLDLQILSPPIASQGLSSAVMFPWFLSLFFKEMTLLD